nr:MAG TPA: hypothetical protein [Caudoviricetes sp.]
MDENLRNKECCRKVKCTIIETGEERIFENAYDAVRKLSATDPHLSPSTVHSRCASENHIYKNKYVFMYV